MADRWGISVHPTVAYPATGNNNVDLPSKFKMSGREVSLDGILEDEKAGFHWAYSRSDQFGGQCGMAQFASPESMAHQEVVYAKDSPITCKKLDFIFPDGAKQTLIVDGELTL